MLQSLIGTHSKDSLLPFRSCWMENPSSLLLRHLRPLKPVRGQPRRTTPRRQQPPPLSSALLRLTGDPLDRNFLWILPASTKMSTSLSRLRQSSSFPIQKPKRTMLSLQRLCSLRHLLRSMGHGRTWNSSGSTPSSSFQPAEIPSLLI